MRVFIEDLVAKTSDKGEQELPKGTTIRFEIGDDKYSCHPTEKGIEIYKIGALGKDQITIRPQVQNKIIVT